MKMTCRLNLHGFLHAVHRRCDRSILLSCKGRLRCLGSVVIGELAPCFVCVTNSRPASHAEPYSSFQQELPALIPRRAAIPCNARIRCHPRLRIPLKASWLPSRRRHGRPQLLSRPRSAWVRPAAPDQCSDGRAKTGATRSERLLGQGWSRGLERPAV